jgi:hypothetical protein
MQTQYAQQYQYAQPTPTTFSPSLSGAYPSSGVQQYRSSGTYPSTSVISNGLSAFPSPASPYAATQYSTAKPVTYAAPTIAGTTEIVIERKEPAMVSSSRSVPVTMPVTIQATPSTGSYIVENRRELGREQALEKKVRDLEALVLSKEKTISELQSAVAAAKYATEKNNGKSKARSPGRSGSGFRKLSASKPSVRYQAADQDDPIDVRLEEFYNSTGSAIGFHRINRGFYRFGETIVEVDIINHKLMARTEDGWNRGKFGPVEKFLAAYENIEREKAGILPES